jgi:hypothetical protein
MPSKVDFTSSEEVGDGPSTWLVWALLMVASRRRRVFTERPDIDSDTRKAARVAGLAGNAHRPSCSHQPAKMRQSAR